MMHSAALFTHTVDSTHVTEKGASSLNSETRKLFSVKAWKTQQFMQACCVVLVLKNTGSIIHGFFFSNSLWY